MAKNRKYPTRENGKAVREYRIWKGMKSRCYAPCLATVGKYQPLGIQVCDRWKNSFDNFMDDMGPCPEGLSIDRIDSTGDYKPENCRWATASVQAKNRGSFNKVFTHDGKSLVLKDWARELNIPYLTLYSRIYTYGMDFQEAIHYVYGKFVTYNGQTKQLIDWVNEFDLKYMVVLGRLRSGWTPEKALSTPTK